MDIWSTLLAISIEREREREMKLEVNDALPFVVMVMLECGDVFAMTLSKAAMNIGMSNLVYLVYFNALGTMLFLPLYIFHRHRSQLPPLTLSLLCKFSFLGLLGVCLHLFGVAGVKYGSPTLASAIMNLIPAFTFLLAISFRMETFDFRRPSSQAKALGAITAISGALVMIFYKGPKILTASSLSKLPHELLLPQQSSWVLGGILLVITCFFGSLWIIAQTAMVIEYPDETTIAFFSCLFGTIQIAVFSLIMERDSRTWSLQSGAEITAIVFAAIYQNLVRIIAVTWCLRKKGPFYVAMFKPTQMVIAVIIGIIVLGDTLCVGSVIGGTIIAVGFYAVMWGAAKEKENIVESGCVIESPFLVTPLLESIDTVQK